VHPHLGEYCRSIDRDHISVDLLKPCFDPPIANPSREIAGSTAALRQKFTEIFASEDIDRAELVRAAVVFYFPWPKRWPAACHIEVVQLGGIVVSATIDSNGRPVELLRTKGGSW
jgi:hypothetical protein